jgi:hypothetical protein
MKLHLISLLLLAALMCNCNGREPMQTKPATVQDVLGFSLPSYAAHPQFFVEKAMDLLTYLKLEIPSDQLDHFLSISAIFPTLDPALKEPARFDSYNTTQKWWTPGELTAPKYGTKTGRRDKWRTSSFLAASCGNTTCLIYFMYFEES